MNININYESTAKRRLIIALTLIPFSLFVAAEGAYRSVASVWGAAAHYWRRDAVKATAP